jgi:two-component system, chemotaxis family, protein-glutamate methylesterase/glutaminase
MAKVKVLVIDGALVIRRLISEVLSQDPDIEVVGFAANGVFGLTKIKQLKPDLITLDIDMPELDGIGVLKAIVAEELPVAVIMCSMLTTSGGEKTLESLALGADDYITQPPNLSTASPEVIKGFSVDLCDKVRAIAAKKRQFFAEKSLAKAPVILAKTPTVIQAKNNVQEKIDILVVGASTGGPNALLEFFSLLPKSLPVPVLVVQHMPALFTKFLAERINNTAALNVQEAEENMEIAPGLVLIAPGNFHMELERVNDKLVVKLNQGAPENSCRPAVDVMFRSVAKLYGANVLAVVLTGMGQDGLLGSEIIVQAGGNVLVQDEASSVVWGMPGVIAKKGIAAKIAPIPMLAKEIMQILHVDKL